jgi:hypothetical protein
MPLEDGIDTTNKFLVGANPANRTIRIVGAPLLHRELTPEDAVNLAAWLVAVAEVMERAPDFLPLLDKVRNT